MDKRELFEILLSKKEVNFDRIHTDYILLEDWQEDIFKERIATQIDKWDRTSAEGESLLSIFVEKGVIFLVGCYTEETSPEGPNNEPPGIRFSQYASWCTKKSPIIYSKRSSGIITGWDENNNRLDMGTSFTDFGKIVHTHSELVSDVQKNNRKMLFELMTNIGFVNYPLEWWHYSYGDQMWAAYSNKDTCFYGPIK